MDRPFRGIIAGVIGGLAMEAWDLFSYYILNFGSFRFLDWAAMMMYGEPPQNIYETMMSFTMQVIWAGFLGIIFVFLIPTITSRGHLLKGIYTRQDRTHSFLILSALLYMVWQQQMRFAGWIPRSLQGEYNKKGRLGVPTL